MKKSSVPICGIPIGFCAKFVAHKRVDGSNYLVEVHVGAVDPQVALLLLIGNVVAVASWCILLDPPVQPLLVNN